jgi:DNA-binding SARP family transcriptional activator
MLVGQRRSRPRTGRHRVTVLGSFTTTTGHGDTVPLEVDARRVVAYLAVHRRRQHHPDLAADLWPGVPESAAGHLLDEALDAVRDAGLIGPERQEPGGPAVAASPGADAGPGHLVLDPAVEVDLDEAMALVRALADAPRRPGTLPDGVPDATALLRHDILPGWTASWLAVERERFRQIRLNALEELSAALSAAGRHAAAVELAEDAVHTAPSRESARRALIEAHLAHGEIAEAVAQYDAYQELLRSSVGASSAFGLEGLLPPVPAWPVLRRQPMQRLSVSPTGLRTARRGPRQRVSGGSVPGTTR